MQVQPYLFFNGRCDEAAEFYKRALGATVEHISRYSDSPEPMAPGMVPPGAEDKVMHMTLRIGETVLMASDGRCNGATSFDGFALTLAPKDEAEARLMFDALADGGTVKMPLGKTFFSPCFGMVDDRFGLAWMVACEP